MTVALVYGFSEGHKISKKLQQQVRDSGYSLTNNVSEADVIIAHSGGSYMLPKEFKAKLVVLINPPTIPNNRMIMALIHKIAKENKDKIWLSKSTLNIYYFLIRPLLWLMKQAVQNRSWPNVEGSQKVIIVRNLSDTFTDSEILKIITETNNWTYEIFDGQHDDLWMNPEPYIELIKKVL